MSSSAATVSANLDMEQIDGTSDQALSASSPLDNQEDPGLGDLWLRARDSRSDEEIEHIEKGPIVIKVDSWLDAVVPARPEPGLLRPRMMSDAEMQAHARAAACAESVARMQRNGLLPPPREARPARPISPPDPTRHIRAALQEHETPPVPSWWLDYHHLRSPTIEVPGPGQEPTAQGAYAREQENGEAYDWLDWE